MTQSIITPGPRPSDTGGREDFRRVDDYGLLADCNSAALVDRYGSIDWLCMPRYDSASVFAAILDPSAGHWSIRPARPFSTERRYLPGTLVVETSFTTDTGTIRLVDAMAFAPGQRGHDLGYDAPHELLRSLECVSGSVELELELAPRPEYGRYRPLIRRLDDGARTFGGTSPIRLRASVPIEVDDQSNMRASFALSEGERAGFSLRWIPVEAQTPPEPTCAARSSPPRPARWPSEWRTPPRRGAPGRPSTTSTRARTRSSSG